MAKGKEKLELRGGSRPRMTRAGRRSFTLARQERFLGALAATCNVAAACRSARVGRTTVDTHRRKNAAFRARWAEAVSDAYGRLELVMLERMMNGTVTTRTRADGSVDKVHQYPNAIALQLLRLHRAGAAEAAVEHDPVDIEEVRERLLRRIERLQARAAAAKGAPAAAPETGG
jgi:hypothetical protein